MPACVDLGREQYIGKFGLAANTHCTEAASEHTINIIL